MRYHGMLIGLMSLFVGGAILSAPTPAQAAKREEIKLGVFSTMTGPGALIGTHLNNGVETAMAILGGKLGDIPAKLFYVDDQMKPEIGRQVADELIKRRKVDFIMGVIWSNVMVAVNGPITQSKTFLLGTVAGLGEFAGRSCSPYFFSASLQNDQMPQAVGKLMSDRGIKDAVVMTANYAGGRDNINGFKRGYSGKISGEIYFALGQQDFSAELSQIRAINPSALFVSAPGAMGIQFAKQYAQSGLKDKIPLYTTYVADELTLPALGDAAIGLTEARGWSPELDNPANRQFVAKYEEMFGAAPSWYAAYAFDAVMLIDDAVRQVGGDLDDKDKVRAALENTKAKSVRGEFNFSKNHFLKQNIFAVEIVKDKDGNIKPKYVADIYKDLPDAYVDECKMN